MAALNVKHAQKAYNSASTNIGVALGISELDVEGGSHWVANAMLAVLLLMFCATTIYAPLFEFCAMVPSKVLTGPYSHMWTLFTAGWAEPDLLTGLINTCLFALLGPFVERHFTWRIFLKFVLFINGLSFIFIYLSIIVWFAISDDLHEFYTAHCGFSAVNASLLVVLKQKFPAESLLGVVQFKHLPILSCTLSLVLWLLLSHVLATQVPLVLFGTLLGWFYLRYVNEDSVTGEIGDVHNEEMGFATLFPEVPLVRGAVQRLADAAFVCAGWTGIFAVMEIWGCDVKQVPARRGDRARTEGVSSARAQSRKQNAQAAVEQLLRTTAEV